MSHGVLHRAGQSDRRGPIWIEAGALALVVSSIAAWNWWYTTQTYPPFRLDLDDWGVLVQRLSEDHRLATLFSAPSMLKGPIVPFVFGLAYYVFPSPAAPLVLNVVCCGLAAAILYAGFVGLGASRVAVAAALLAWIAFPPHRYVAAYYYAEPVLTLMLAALVMSACTAVTRRGLGWALVSGALGALLLLARPPHVLIVALAIPAILWWHVGPRRVQALVAYGAMFFLCWTAWPIRNYLAHDRWIVFTTEGGRVAFESVYVAGDDGSTASVRTPEYQALEAQVAHLPLGERYAYWQRHAWDQVVSDPVGQLRLSLKKAMRFWMYVPDHSWTPTLKTAGAALVYLPLAAFAVVRGRHLLFVRASAAVVLALWAVHTVAHSELRYNYPVLPFTFVLAATGLCELWNRIKTWRPGAQPGARLT